MRRKNLLWIVTLAAIGALAAPAPQPKARPAPAPTPAEEEGVIDPRADDALRKMSTYLAGLQSFRVDARVVDEKVTTEGQKLQELSQTSLTVQRPNRLRADRFGPNGHASLRSDGKHVTVFNQDKNLFATITVPPSLDAALDELRARLQIDAPGADFLFSDPYKELIDGVLVGRYIGLEPVGEVMAHHLAMTEKDVDWQVWIAAGDRPTPLRYVITTKDLPGHPEFTLELSNWQIAPPLAPDTFSLTPPANAKRVELAPPADRPVKP